MNQFSVNAIEQWPTKKLIPYARNARTHDENQVGQIAGSIAEFGFVNPILVGEDNIIIAGHGRLLAAERLEMDMVPVIVLSHLSEAQRKALVIADNKLAENAGWDEDLLSLELADLEDLDFDLDLLGFSGDELDNLLLNTDANSSEEEDSVPEPEDKAISALGDVWILGEHKLLCGDSTHQDSLHILLGEELADMAFTDPPYNVDYGNTAKDKMRGNHRKILNDNLGNDFYDFLKAAMENMLNVTKGACYVAMSSSELHTLQKAFKDAGGKWSTFIVWAKNHFTLGRSDYQRQYEPILYGWKNGGDHYWCGDRNQSDVWYFDKPVKADLHPTMKPVDLVSRAILNSSKTRDIVLDLFGGSGSTLIACEKTKRRARLIELDPRYVDVIIRRWQEISGSAAKRESDEVLFNDLENASA